MKKKLSIITVCYNEPNLEKTCESIINQTWQNFEWIVIDGGSNETTQKIWDKYKYRIDKFISEPDNGIYNASNKGLKLASGEYVIFMNAGDVFFDKDVLSFYNFFSDNNKADVYYGETEFLYGRKVVSHDYISRSPHNMTKSFFISSNICTQSVFIKKSLFEEQGMFNEDYKIVSDYDRWIKFIDAGSSFMYMPIIVSSFDMNGLSNNLKYNTLLASERNKVLKMYYTDEEINKAKKNYKANYTILENIFSIKNNQNKTHKVITILGSRIKIRRRAS